MKLRLTIVLLTLGSHLAVAAQPAEPDIFFLSVGNADYRSLASSDRKDPRAREFGNVDGARHSARHIAELLASRGARGGELLVSDVDRFVTWADVDHALDRVLARAAKSVHPLVVVYFVGHGISEGVGWNHFSVPGDFVGHIDPSDLPGLAKRTVYAGDLADKLEKHKMHYLVLLDSCYEGKVAQITPDILTSRTEQTLLTSFAALRNLNEFHQADPVVYSTAPGTVVLVAADPTEDGSQQLIGPLARRVLLATHDGRAMSVSAFVRALLDRNLDTATAAAVSWAELEEVERPFLRPAAAAPATPFLTTTGTGHPKMGGRR